MSTHSVPSEAVFQVSPLIESQPSGPELSSRPKSLSVGRTGTDGNPQDSSAFPPSELNPPLNDCSNVDAAGICREGKVLVVCVNGTENSIQVFPHSNARKFHDLLVQEEGVQVCTYRPGIGTGAKGIFAPFKNLTDKLFATSLKIRILEAYLSLMDNHTKLDKIHLFGYSRGAYVVRAVAGMIHKIGLLPKGSPRSHLDRAYSLYEKAQDSGDSADWI